MKSFANLINIIIIINTTYQIIIINKTYKNAQTRIFYIYSKFPWGSDPKGISKVMSKSLPFHEKLFILNLMAATILKKMEEGEQRMRK